LNGGFHVRVTDDPLDDHAVLHLARVGLTHVDAEIAAPPLSVPADVGDHPRAHLDVILYLHSEFVVGVDQWPKACRRDSRPRRASGRSGAFCRSRKTTSGRTASKAASKSPALKSAF